MFVVVEDAAGALASSYVEAGYLVRICDWRGQSVQRALAMPWCWRCPLENCSNSRRAWVRWRWFQIRVRFRSSRRQVCTHLSMIEFILGI